METRDKHPEIIVEPTSPTSLGDVAVRAPPPPLGDAVHEEDFESAKEDYESAGSSVKAVRFSPAWSREGSLSSSSSAALPRSWILTETTAGASMMPDTDEMKRRVRQKLAQKRYNVCDYYHDTGFFQRIARHQRFDNAALCVIFINSIYMAIDADFNHSNSLGEALPVFQVCENAFCLFFTAELTIRFLSFKRKCNCFRDFWFVFDLALVAFMVVETWFMAYLLPLFGFSLSGGGLANTGVLRLLRLLRLTRMSRMVRLLKSAPELVVLLKGILEASSSCGWTAMLLMIAMYIWGLALKHLSAETAFGAKYFSTIPTAMYHLLVTGCFMKGFNFAMDDISAESFFCAGFYFLFVLFAGVTVMKMLTGMLCKVVNAVAASEIEKMSVGAFRDEILEVFMTLGFCGKNEDAESIQDIDIDNLQITLSMFGELMNNPRAVEAFRKIGVDVVSLVSAADFIFPLQGTKSKTGPGDTPRKHHCTLGFADFMESILELRGSNTATVKDIMSLRKFVRIEVEQLEHKFTQVSESLHAVTHRTGSGTETPRSSSILQRKGTGPASRPDTPHASSSPGIAVEEDKVETEEGECDGNQEDDEDAEEDQSEDEADFQDGRTAQRVLKDLCSLSQVAEESAPTLKRRKPSLIPWSELNSLKKASLCKLALCEGVSEANLEEALETADAKNALVSLILSREADVVRCSSEKNGKKFVIGSRVMAITDIDYRGGMQVPAGTCGTVLVAAPALLVDWDSLTTLDYATCMLDYTEVPAMQVERIDLTVKAIKVGMYVVVTEPICEEFLELDEGQQGVVLSVDEANGAFVDFFDAGKHMIMPHFLQHLTAEAERTRLLRLLSDHDRGSACSRGAKPGVLNGNLQVDDPSGDYLPRCFQLESNVSRKVVSQSL